MRLLARTLAMFASAAVGLLVAAWLIEGVQVSIGGFLLATVVFALAQTILAPVISGATRRYAPAALGGAGLGATLLALFVATLLPGGLHISGLVSWLLATLLMWLISAVGISLLPPVLLKRALRRDREEEADSSSPEKPE